MRREHEPLFIQRWRQWWNTLYVKSVLRPQFDKLGTAPFFYHPQSLCLAGKNIIAGDHLHMISENHKPVNLTTWSSKQSQGHITIGDNCLLSPGVSIASAASVTIGNDCMLAAEVNISDCDWHGIYNRTRPFRCTSAVTIENNVWIGLRAIIGKGISIGDNSIVAAGSVVTENVAANTIVGGNPARVIKHINPKRRMLTRSFLFKDAGHYDENQDQLRAYLFGDNTLFHWLKTKVAPSQED